ncbi:hypothetical protein Hanom_Chr11g01007321 [Helianthus anomalus]
MDIQWQMAMISRRVKRFMIRTGRKFVGKSVGFDKTKVKFFNCQSINILVANAKDQNRVLELKFK